MAARLRLTFASATGLIAAVFVTLLLIRLAVFKVGDLDVWWHLKAGQIMLETGSLIRIDPFAWTREGLPYLATHEWLAQIILALTHHIGGFGGLIALRTVLFLATLLPLSLLIRRHHWFFTLFLIPAGIGVIPGFLDRPQMFTYLLFSWSLFLAFRFLDTDPADTRRRWRTACIALALQVLWVNLHGGAGVIGMLVYGIALIADVVRMFRAGEREAIEHRVPRFHVPFAVLLGLTLLASPDTYHNITYILSLLSDKTVGFIGEWQPRALPEYLTMFGLWWVVAIASIASGRRHVVFSVLVLCVTGTLSRSAIRHETLFALTAAAITLYQLSRTTKPDALLTSLAARRWPVPVIMLVALGIGMFCVQRSYAGFTYRFGWQGTGVRERLAGAYDFIEQHNLTGPAFNSYDAGNYLLYRGYPERKVFVDGRNVDYGYDFLLAAFKAGQSTDAWQALDEKYDFTHAVIDYAILDKTYPLPYVSVLEQDPDWALVYVDDHAAVYVKNVLQNGTLVSSRYSLLSPAYLTSSSPAVPRENLPVFEQELTRAVDARPQDIRARLALARLYGEYGFTDDAVAIARTAIGQEPASADAHLLLGTLLLEQDKEEAAFAFARALSLIGSADATIRYEVIADAFAESGHPVHAMLYRVGVAL